MAETIFVGVAWPYANGSLHLGHIAGAYLPADIFSRYQRARGNRVLMVSGSDQHGTPITIRAEQEGLTPKEVAERYHREFLVSWARLGIDFDLYTGTETQNHQRVVHDVFLRLLEKGHIYRASMFLPYCPRCVRYLPDRYVEGTCPFCGFPDARGDQCDRCGKPLSYAELIMPRCRICGETPETRESEHFFLKLSAFQDVLLDWVRQQTHWRGNVLNFTLRYLEDGLKDRAITRDMEWGIPVPVPGYESKRIYVWFEAVIGYLSASIEWAATMGDPDGWKPFWQDGKAKPYYFIGKDNIPFHTMIWPAMLMGYGGMNLPYNVPANEFLTLEGRQLSTSRNWAVWVPDYLDRYEPDPLRYVLSVNMPESGDTDFSWREFVRRNNDELLANYGNLVHRVLTFAGRHFGSIVPEPSALDAGSETLLAHRQAALDQVGAALEHCKFKDGIKTAMGLAQEANRYLEEKSPWKTVKTDRQECANAVFTAIQVIASLRTIFYPFLPFTSQKLHEMLGFEGRINEQNWAVQDLPPGHKLGIPQPLFIKLDERVAEEETARMAAMKTPAGQSKGAN